MFYPIFATGKNRYNKTIVSQAEFYALLYVGSNTECNLPCSVLVGKQFMG